jgi:hypothetical protein
VADRLRCHMAAQRGVPERELIPWPRLKESEQRQWLELADVAIAALRP